MPVPRVVNKTKQATAHALKSVGGLHQYPPDYPCMVVTETEVVIQVDRRKIGQVLSARLVV
jgi:hypothetical protein